ncbi:MAG TPA: hypothetical protein VFB78_09805 [Acidimicrobiales bacterium]|nr:hypothetical protein [Acidimicrobiales bacterium]
MDSWRDVTIGDLTNALRRYLPFLAAVVAVMLVALLLPGHGDRKDDVKAAAASLNDTSADSGVTTTVPAGDAVTTEGTGGLVDTGGVTARTPGTGAVKLPSGAVVGPDCDPATGRIKVLSLVAPPCMPPFSGNNGGATALGVTAKTIKVIYYQPQEDPATTAALTAAGANNTPDQQWQTTVDYVDYFNKFYETYGRKVVLERLQGSGDPSDPAAANADAATVVSKHPFAVFGGNLPSFYEVLARNKILCICTTSQPQETYEKNAPYVGYTPLMASTQAYIHRAEYIGKRLAGRNAVFAGSPVLKAKPRVFGLLYYETPDKAYRAGAEFFRKEITKYGTSFKVVVAYRGPPDYAGLREDVRPLIQKMKDEGVTSIACACDPISPALFTHEATNQQYQPEWIITGSALTDTDLFARTYDPLQWSHAFGISLLTARLPKVQGEAWKIYQWHFNKTPPADNQYGILYPIPLVFFTGLHLAGPNLTVQSWQKGLFSFPVTNKGRKTQPTTSYGQHNVWSMVDYTGADDVTEIWWDPNTVGPDELDNQGAGMYRYVDGGKRYLPGEHPRSDPKPFVTAGTVTIYDQPPPGETTPNYPHTPYHNP